jgi:aspartate/methionine/tyrosine aminotransferase
MQTRRMAAIPGFGIDRVAAAAGSDPEVLRLENLDTDLLPHDSVLAATRAAVGPQPYNSWLPFTGKLDLKQAAARQYAARSGITVDAERQITITCGEGDAMLDALFVTTDPGDEVVLTDPTYAGMINRVRLCGAVPRLVPLTPASGNWRLDLDALQSAVTDKTRAIFVSSPSLPTGHVFNRAEWEAIAAICNDRDLWLIYLAWMETILFDGVEYIHPASLPGMKERVLHVGAVTLEQRMIGWRIGWVVAPEILASDMQRAHIYNGLVAGGIGQAGSVAALNASQSDLSHAIAEWLRRRDAIIEQLDGLPYVRPNGGWSMVMEAQALGIAPPDLSMALIKERVAATPMTAWGETVAPRFIRFIFATEPVERLALLRERLDRAMNAFG